MKKALRVFLVVAAVMLLFFSFNAYAEENDEAIEERVEITGIQNSVGYIKISFEKFPEAEEYEIQRRVNDGNWSDITVTENTFFKDKKIKNGNIYTYRIRAVTEKGKSGYGEKSYMYLGSPVIKSVKSTADGLLIKWKRCTVATGYRVYRKSEGEKEYKLISTLKGNTPQYTDKKVTSGKKYSYKVKQISGEYISAYKSKGTSAVFVAKTESLSASNSPKGVMLRWKEVKGAKGYSVWRKTGNSGSWKKIGVTKNISYNDKSTFYGKKNYYKVRAYRSSGIYGVFSGETYIYSVNPDKPMLALTYDDGPYAPATNRILSALEKSGGRATFFVVGSRVATYADCIRRQAALGCEIANHSFSHPALTALKPKEIREEIGKTDKLIKEYSGQAVRLVRAPGGAVSDKVRANVKHPLVNWSVDTLDWDHRTASKTVAAIKSRAFDGAIILMHDLYLPTAEASEAIIPYLVKEGYQLVTVSELFEAKGISPEKGKLYTRG